MAEPREVLVEVGALQHSQTVVLVTPTINADAVGQDLAPAAAGETITSSLVESRATSSVKESMDRVRHP